MIIVIADDVTGAAEMAGVALRNNMKVKFVTELDRNIPMTDVLIIATDTRSFSQSKAVETIRHIAGYLTNYKDIYVFKKTDSVLRGHITAELKTLSEHLGYNSTILLPQTPSKGRIISNGKYYINSMPLDKTSFGFDPEFPAKTSDVESIVQDSVTMAVDEPVKQWKINIGDASDIEELKKQVDKANRNVLIAGAADTFNIFLNKFDVAQKEQNSIQQNINTGKTLVICGSTQSTSLINTAFFIRRKSKEESMPYDVFHGGAANDWFDILKQSYSTHTALIIKIGHKSTGGKEYATRLRTTMSDAVYKLINVEKPALLIIEGGATAFAALKKLNWNSFNVKKELAPGVVCLNYKDTDIILKPGSYSWGHLFE